MRLTLLASALATGCLLASPAVLAQTVTPSPTTDAQTSASSSESINGRTTFKAANGTIVTVKSYQPAHVDTAPAPAFSLLDTDDNDTVDATEAASYPLLANDFQYADGNDDKAISQSEYEHWLKQP